jgi:hypothetical protein
MALHCPVALTCAVLQRFRIEDLDFPADVLDQTGRLQGMRDDSHTRSLDPGAFPLSILA